MRISVILFEDFETLDVFGPVEIFGKMSPDFALDYFSLEGGIVSNSDNVGVRTKPIGEAYGKTDVMFVPGGMGTRQEAGNRIFLDHLKSLSIESKYILSVCTGSLLLARAGVLADRSATTNKRAFSEVARSAPGVKWIRKARWVKDGNIYTSSGVSAGMDMALAFIEDLSGRDAADSISRRIEYERNSDSRADRFAGLYG